MRGREKHLLILFYSLLCSQHLEQYIVGAQEMSTSPKPGSVLRGREQQPHSIREKARAQRGKVTAGKWEN